MGGVPHDFGRSIAHSVSDTQQGRFMTPVRRNRFEKPCVVPEAKALYIVEPGEGSKHRSYCLLVHAAGAPGNRSITYFLFATDMIGTPGIFLSRRFRSRSYIVVSSASITRGSHKAWTHVRSHQVHPVLGDPIHQAVIGISPLVITLEPLPPRVSRDPQGQAISRT